MSKLISIILFALALATTVISQPVNQTQHWFNHQLTDHYDITSNSTWSQRYWVHDQYFNPTNGSVLLYICGEYTCPGIPEERQFPIQLAQQFNSIILVLEHRFYGNSMPFGEQSMKQQNLRLLNVDQALADLAYFITFVKDHKLHHVQHQNPWITIGGSYPGAMSAWFRYKYPHLTVGALASSAVVNAILDYPQFDEQIRRSALLSSEECAQSIHDLNMFVQQALEDPVLGDQIKQQFGAEKLNNGEFLYFYADIFVEFVQYGTRTQLCDSILNYPTFQEKYDSIVNYARDNDVTPFYYGSYYLKNDTFDNNDGSRQWTWQYCTEFGFLQTSSSNPQTTMRGTNVTLDVFRQLCADSFSTGIWPNSKRVNIQYGDVHLKAFNLILTNGIEDPWRWAGLQKSKGKVVSYLIDCQNCAHCVELYTPKDTDAPILKKTRAKITAHFSKWINEHYENLQKEEQSEEIFDLFVEQMLNRE